jgi:diaminohydroxyphosphoribosylaminopyrimidine deaminase/5-amino-6-(5-phosphoribosylamino)uracil reductase
MAGCNVLHSTLTSLKSFRNDADKPIEHVSYNIRTKFNRGSRRGIPVVAVARGDNLLTSEDLSRLTRTALLADSSSGKTQPHPNSACTIVNSEGKVIAEAFQWAQGTEAPETQAARLAGPAARGATAFLNLETGHCHGDTTAIEALIQSGISRVIIGMRHPLSKLKGAAITELRNAGVVVLVLGEAELAPDVSLQESQSALHACLTVNEALLHRAVLKKPLGLLKYAMTLDGKIATTVGHSAWVSSPESRAEVFEARSRSDAVIVGGNTLRRDNPRLTTRREGGHQPARVVMSRTLDLPDTANMWEMSHAPTIVMTQKGVRRQFQDRLRSLGVEVVEFPFLTPEKVAEYCYERGFLQCLWECGGTLAAPAISGGVIHKIMAFIAPKLIGGCRAPTPVGDLGFVEMTQALPLTETSWEVSGPDLMFTGYLPTSGGPLTLAAAGQEEDIANGGNVKNGSTVASSSGNGKAVETSNATSSRVNESGSISFYKAWDHYGCLSNFSPHSVMMPGGTMAAACLDSEMKLPSSHNNSQQWSTVEHYYQSQKFTGVDHPAAIALVEQIKAAASPEEAAALGRRHERYRKELLRPDWADAKVAVMHAVLRAKFKLHKGPRECLLETKGMLLVENSPHDLFWGSGIDGKGGNRLGHLLMKVRDEILAAQPREAPAAEAATA